MKPFCEIIVQSVLPATRALLAKELMDKHNLTQQEAAHKLGVSQAAISQYRRSLRGRRVKILMKNKKTMAEIQSLATKLAKNKLTAITAMHELCLICKIIRQERVICAMHHGQSPGLKGCNICLEKSPC